MVGPVAGYAITDEQAGGVKATTQPPVAVGFAELAQRRRTPGPRPDPCHHGG